MLQRIQVIRILQKLLQIPVTLHKPTSPNLLSTSANVFLAIPAPAGESYEDNPIISEE